MSRKHGLSHHNSVRLALCPILWRCLLWNILVAITSTGSHDKFKMSQLVLRQCGGEGNRLQLKAIHFNSVKSNRALFDIAASELEDSVFVVSLHMITVLITGNIVHCKFFCDFCFRFRRYMVIRRSSCVVGNHRRLGDRISAAPCWLGCGRRSNVVHHTERNSVVRSCTTVSTTYICTVLCLHCVCFVFVRCFE